jgi:hypothetical protein
MISLPRKVQLQVQVFQRSFSKKGAGRGLGTYGMAECYLGGIVSFQSVPTTAPVHRDHPPIGVIGDSGTSLHCGALDPLSEETA